MVAKTDGSERIAELKRKTRETEITASINLDGAGKAEISSGVGFFDHMLTALAKHSAIDIKLVCKGDTQIDDHHSVEDIGIVLGQAIQQALGTKAGICRFGFASVPLDEALAQATVNLSGRGGLYVRGRRRLPTGKVGTFDVELLEDFLQALASAGGITLHVEIRAGRNRHHILEATMKAVARALREAASKDSRIADVPSTKGVL